MNSNNTDEKKNSRKNAGFFLIDNDNLCRPVVVQRIPMVRIVLPHYLRHETLVSELDLRVLVRWEWYLQNDIHISKQ